MLNLGNARIGDQLARYGEFVLGQGSDKPLSGLDGGIAREQQRQRMARSSKGDTGPGFFGVREDLTVMPPKILQS